MAAASTSPRPPRPAPRSPSGCRSRDPPARRPALDCFEWNQHARGLKLLTPLRRSKDATVAAAAEKLHGIILADGRQWQADADRQADEKPLAAYDLYARVAAAFVGDDLGRSADAAMKKLAGVQAVKDELAARKAYQQFLTALGRATPAQRQQAGALCQSIAKKFPGTPSAEKAAALAKELGE